MKIHEPHDMSQCQICGRCLICGVHTHPSAPEDTGTEREGNNTQVDNVAKLREATERTVSALNDPQSATMQQVRRLVFGVPDTSEIGCQSNFTNTPDRTPRQSLEDIPNRDGGTDGGNASED